MLGVPAASSLTLAMLFAVGLLLAGSLVVVLRRSWPASFEERAVAVAVLALVISAPYLVWRVVEDVRYTTGLDSYEQASAGPIQAFLPGYLADRADALLPPEATYATIVGPSVANRVAAQAFPFFVMDVLFPRRSATPSTAQWLVAWGVPKSSLARRGRVYLVHAALGPLPAVFAVRVER